MAIHLRGELHLGVIQVRDADVLPSESQQLRDTSAGQRRQREQRPIRLAGSGDRLLKLASLEQPALRTLARLRPLGRQQERDRVGSGSAEAARRVAIDPIHDADDDDDRRLGKPVGA
jgi:hypothetical protein